MTKKLWFVSVMLLSLAAFGLGQTDRAAGATLPDELVQELDSVIDRHIQENNLPGVVVGIWIPNEGEYVVAKGTANLETGRAREVGDPFRIGSITKPFIATAVLQLVDQGRLSKTDTLATWYPDFPNADSITIEDLLRMRSGIADYWDGAALEEYYDRPLQDATADDIIALSAERADEFVPPDEKTVYTNVNYILLDEIVRKVTGNDVNAQLAEGIFEPLGLESTLYPTGFELPGELHGYGWNAETETFEDKTVLDPAPPGGAGAMISDIWDLRTYARALCTGALLEPETHEARLQVTHMDGFPDFVGYGEGITKFGEFCGHNGTIMGFSSEMWYLPVEDAVMIINVNRLDADDRSWSSPLFFELSKVLFPDHVEW